MNIKINKYNKLYGVDYYNCPYYVLKYYSDNLIYVKDEDNNDFYIDADNNKINIFVSDSLFFENGGALVNVFDNESDCKTAVINKNAEYIIEPSGGNIVRTKTGYVVLEGGKDLKFYDFEGNLLNILEDCFISNFDLKTSFLIEGIGNIRKNFLSGLVNSKGEIVQPIKNRHRFEFSSDYKYIKLRDDYFKSIYHVYDSEGAFIGSYNKKLNPKKHIYINEKSRKLEKKNYSIDSDFTPLALVSFNGKYGYIDSNDNIKIPIIYNQASRFINDIACVDDKIINTEGETVCDLKKYIPDFVKYEDKTIWQVVGNLFILDFSSSSADHKYLVFQTNQKIDEYYKMCNHIYFKFNKKKGIMDFDGNVILDAEYTDCKLLDGKLFYVALDDGEYVLNGQKNKILSYKNYISVLNDNMILFQEDDFKGVMDFSGNIIIEPLFESIIYSNGKLILDGKILKSLPNKNSNCYHVSYNLDVTIDDKTITKVFDSCFARDKYINYLNEEKEKIEMELKLHQDKLKQNLEIQQNKLKQDLENQLNNLKTEARQKLIRRC